MQVEWDQNKCRHAGVCVKSLPEVFKVEEGQFVIDPSQASEGEIIDAIKQCPSAALSFTQ